jgi:hypothetical protein
MKKLLVICMVAACAEAEQARLDHAQILAVRAEPANIAPGERARIDVLAGDTAGNVFEAVPDTLVARGATVERTPEGWFVTAGVEPAIAELALTLEIDGLDWPAIKRVPIHARVDNPVAAMTIDGAPATEMIVAAGTRPELTATPSGTGPFTYAWYSSVGDLELYRQETAILDAAAPKQGHLVLVVRDGAGGVSWQLLPARVE